MEAAPAGRAGDSCEVTSRTGPRRFGPRSTISDRKIRRGETSVGACPGRSRGKRYNSAQSGDRVCATWRAVYPGEARHLVQPNRRGSAGARRDAARGSARAAGAARAAPLRGRARPEGSATVRGAAALKGDSFVEGLVARLWRAGGGLRGVAAGWPGSRAGRMVGVRGRARRKGPRRGRSAPCLRASPRPPRRGPGRRGEGATAPFGSKVSRDLEGPRGLWDARRRAP